MTTVQRMLALVLVLSMAGSAPAQSKAEDLSHAERKALIGGLSTVLRVQVLGHAMNPAVLYATRICGLENVLQVLQMFGDDAPGKRADIISVGKEIDEMRAAARQRKIRPAECSAKQVDRLMCEPNASSACRTFREDAESILGYSLVDKSRLATVAAKDRDRLRALSPLAVAGVEADVVAVLTLAGIDAEPVKAWFSPSAPPIAEASPAPSEN
jgi:hypothetical protein